MLLTAKQYNQLAKLHLNELNKETFKQKADAMGLYFNQSDKVLSFVKNLPLKDFLKVDELNKKLASFDVTINSFNKPMTNQLRANQAKMITIAVDHTKDYLKVAKIPFSPDKKLAGKLLDSLNTPIDDSKFKLSSSIWGAEKRDAIYQYIKNNVKQGVSRSELTKNLEEYLQGNDKKGNYYKATRVISTEFQRAYVEGGIESSRSYNEDAQDGQKLVWYRKTSSGHSLSDVCDELAGTYSIDSEVPVVPSHPFCICITGRMFEEDNTNDIKQINVKDGFYTSEKYKSKVPVF